MVQGGDNFLPLHLEKDILSDNFKNYEFFYTPDTCSP